MRSLLLSPLLALGFAACGTDLDSPGLQPGEMGFGPASVQNYGAPLAESALVKLYRDNASTLTPDPVYSSVYDSHPPAAIRIARLQELAR